MNLNILVSVIITTYKRSFFLKEAIESALNQTYRNIEVLVIDDNNENAKESIFVKNLVDSIKIKDSRLYYYSMHKNFGAVLARNFGADKAKGEYINFLDDDDLLINTKIEKQLNKFEEVGNKFGMIGGYEFIIDKENNIIGDRQNKISGNIFFENLCDCICQTSVPLIRKNLFLSAGGFGEIPSSQEHYMLARLLDKNPYYDYIDDYVVKIRHYEGNRISLGQGKVKGAILLAEKFKQYYYKLTNEQIKKVDNSMNVNIINAYININDKVGALKYYIRSKMMFNSCFKSNMKMLIKILVGKKFISYFMRRKYKLK